MTRRNVLAMIGASLVVDPHPTAARAPADSPRVRNFDSHGVKLCYFVQGRGEPVILIHGWLSSARINWAFPGTSELVAKDFQVIALDMRGHGVSDKSRSVDDYGPELVEAVVRLLDRLKIKKAHIVGYSMGGIVAANFIVKHPERVLSGTLAGMGWLQEGGFGQFAFARIKKNDPNADALALCGRSLAKLALTREQIKSIRLPMMVLVGDRDNVIRRLYLDPLRRVRPDWPVVDIKDADHISCILKPEFKEAIAAWLKKNTGLPRDPDVKSRK